MPHRLEVLIEIQAEIQHCRFLADHMPDPEAAERAPVGGRFRALGARTGFGVTPARNKAASVGGLFHLKRC